MFLASTTPRLDAQPSARPPAIYRHITHLGWIVQDAAATADAWRRPGVRDIGPSRQELVRLDVNRTPTAVRIARIAARLGNGRVDWIQPLVATGP